METWFILALISLVFTGLHIFIQKVGVMRKYNSSLLNSYSAGISAVFGFIIAGFIEGYSEFSLFMLGIALLSGIVYIFGTNFRMDALKYIDTTILLPLHKFVSPIIALVFGIFIFSETVTITESIGIVLGISVPLLLINQHESNRQTNLSKGLILMTVSAVLAAAVAAVNKYGANAFSSVLLFAATANAFSAVAGSLLYRYRKKGTLDMDIEVHYRDRRLLILGFISGLVQVFAFGTFMLALANDGPLGIIYTIHSLYILIPIVLSIIIYKEHWNMQKALAIGLSVVALILLG